MNVQITSRLNTDSGRVLLSSVVSGQNSALISVSNLVNVQHFSLPAGETPDIIRTDYHVTLHQAGTFKLHSTHNGENRSVRTVKPGMIHFRPASVPHQSQWTGPAAFTVIGLTPALMANSAHDLFKQDIEVFNLAPALGHDDPFVWQLGQQIASLATNEAVPTLYVEQLAVTLAMHVLVTYRTDRPAPTSSSRTLTKPMLSLIDEYIQRNLEQKINLADLANLAGMSLFQFIRQFKKLTHQTPARYVLTQKMNHARTLLAHGTVTETAFLLQYANPSHFADAFRSVFGLTPSEYKKQL